MNPANIALSLATVGLVLTFLSSVGAKALREFSRHELEEICSRCKDDTRLKAILLRHERTSLAAEIFSIVWAGIFVLSACYYAWFTGTPDQLTPLRMFGSGVGILLILVSALFWLPWPLVRLWAEQFVYHLWPTWVTIASVMTPLMWIARFVDTVAHRLAGRPPEFPTEESFEDEIRTIVTEGHREGLLEDDAREMIEGVIDLADADVSEIMTPRTDMVCMHVGLSLQEALEFVIRHSHTRIPVFEKTRDDIVGILYAKDLLPELARPNPKDRRRLIEILRQPYFVPETKPVDALLEEFQLTRNHMAVVLDEYGGVSGLVTIEDVLEEIVGEIVDEYDEDVVEGITRIDERVAETLARVHIHEINEQLGLELDENGDFDTIGGFVFSQLGRIPKAEETLVHDNVRITVLEATPRRIERLRIEIMDEVEPQSV